jgi:hypothetical protein
MEGTDHLSGSCFLLNNFFIHMTKCHHLLVSHCRAVIFPGRSLQRDSVWTWASYLGWVIILAFFFWYFVWNLRCTNYKVSMHWFWSFLFLWLVNAESAN